MERKIIDSLVETLGACNVRLNEEMKNHTTFRIGGKADCFVTPNTEEEAGEILRLLLVNEIPYFILGNGSNLLVSDEGFRGVIIQIYKNYDEIEVNGNVITAKAGALLSKIAREALNAGLTGMEFASGIPGTLGGAVFMNAGAYGGEMKQIVNKVRMLDIETGKIVILGRDEMMFDYRSSIIKTHPYLVLSAELELDKGNPDEIKARMDDLNEQRISKQPLNYPSAGSTFKRPEGYFAGKLIQDAGLKGYRVGGAEVSEKHSGFVVNVGNATAADVLNLIRDVRERVNEAYGVMLEPEVLMLGENFKL